MRYLATYCRIKFLMMFKTSILAPEKCDADKLNPNEIRNAPNIFLKSVLQSNVTRATTLTFCYPHLSYKDDKSEIKLQICR